MKTYTAKTVEEALLKASEAEGIAVEELCYEVIEEKRGLFSKKAEIAVFDITDAINYGKEYLQGIIKSFGLTADIEEKYEDGIIRLTINSDHNSVLIGKNGKTLQSLNELIRIALNNKFARRYRILLDINEYKNDKYSKLVKLAKRVAKEVQQTHIKVDLDPMPSDERRIIHNALTRYNNIKTDSEGSGNKRHITISYIENKE